jgi:DNA-binding MarR family transcriptional regulator
VSPKLQATGKKKGDAENRSVGQAIYSLISTAVRSEPRAMSLTSQSTLATLLSSGPRRITDLAAIEGVTQPSMTVLVSGLERAGLVERRSDAADKRVALVALTPAGSAYIGARRRAGVDAFVQLLDELPAHEADALAAALPALTHLAILDQGRRDLTTPPYRERPGGVSP